MGLIQLPTFQMRTDEQIVPMQYEHLFGLKLGPHDAEYEKYIPNYRDYIYDNSVFEFVINITQAMRAFHL